MCGEAPLCQFIVSRTHGGTSTLLVCEGWPRTEIGRLHVSPRGNMPAISSKSIGIYLTFR